MAFGCKNISHFDKNTANFVLKWINALMNNGSRNNALFLKASLNYFLSGKKQSFAALAIKTRK